LSKQYAVSVKIDGIATGAVNAIKQVSATLNQMQRVIGQARVAQGINQINRGFGQVAGEARAFAANMAIIGTATAGVFGAFIQPAAQMEGLRNTMQNLYNGDMVAATQRMNMLKQFALTSAYGLDTLSESWSLLKMAQFENEPVFKGVMNYLGGVGKEGHQAKNVVLALSQAWSKTKLQGDDIKQLVNASIPVWDILSQKMGKSVAVLQGMASAGKLGRQEMMLLMTELTVRSIPMAKNMSQLWTTITSNLGDVWSQFADSVMNTPIKGIKLFDQIKKDLAGLTGILAEALNPKSAKGQQILTADSSNKCPRGGG
jgi:tape measure domain-containing protein